jgi:hypothetical protein
MTENRHDEMKQMLDDVLNEDITLNIPLGDLIWTIIYYSYMMRDNEDMLFQITLIIQIIYPKEK